MARPLPEKIKWIEERIEKSSALIAEAFSQKDYGQIQLSSSLLANHQMKLGLLHWRQKKDPTLYFKAAVSSINLTSSHLGALDPESRPTDLLPVTGIIYAAFLSNFPFIPLGLDQQNGHSLARAFFGNVLIGSADIADWPKYRDALPRVRRTELARRTNELYADLLAGRIAPDIGVKLGEKFWEERENNEWFLDGGEGGGDDNHRLVDYRLGAILKKIGSTVPTIHAWVW